MPGRPLHSMLQQARSVRALHKEASPPTVPNTKELADSDPAIAKLATPVVPSIRQLAAPVLSAATPQPGKAAHPMSSKLVAMAQSKGQAAGSSQAASKAHAGQLVKVAGVAQSQLKAAKGTQQGPEKWMPSLSKPSTQKQSAEAPSKPQGTAKRRPTTHMSDASAAAQPATPQSTAISEAKLIAAAAAAGPKESPLADMKPKAPPRKRAKPDDLDVEAVKQAVQQKQAAGKLQELSVNELKVALKARKLPVGGKKGDLLARLQSVLSQTGMS